MVIINKYTKQKKITLKNFKNERPESICNFKPIYEKKL